PQGALYPGTLRCQGLPALTTKETLEALIGQFGISYSHLPEELLRVWLMTVSVTGPNAVLQELVHEHVDPAQEEAGHGRHGVERLAIGSAPFQGPDVGLRQGLIVRDSEEQRNVDRDTGIEHLFNSRYPSGGPRDFDEHIGSIHGVIQPPRLLHGGSRIVRQMGRYFQAHKAI